MKTILVALITLTSISVCSSQIDSNYFSIGAGVETIILKRFLGPGLSMSYGHNFKNRWWLSSHLSYHQWNYTPQLRMRDLEIHKKAINPFPKNALNKKGFYQFEPNFQSQYFITLSIGLEWDFIKNKKHYFSISPLLALNYFSYSWDNGYFSFKIQADEYEFDDDTYWYDALVQVRTINFFYGIDFTYKYFLTDRLALGLSHTFYQFPLIALPQLQLLQLTLTKTF